MTDKKVTATVSPAANTTGNLMIVASPDWQLGEIVCNFDVKESGGRKRYIEATNDPDLRPSDLDGEVFLLVYWMAEKVSLVSERTGEMQDLPRLTLWDHEDRRMVSTSWPVAHFINRLQQTMSPGPFSPPIPITIENVIRKDGRRSYRCAIADV